jgi:drug/metabolite transporter (DMT)-like permease
VAVVLSLVSALMYGVSDYVGGRASRRVPPVAIACFAEVMMLPIALVAIPVVEDGGPPGSAVGWGLVAGFAGSIGVVGLYIALARGNMTVVAPVTAVVAAAVPVIVGIALGERPGVLALVGIAAALIAVGLIGGAADLLRASAVRLPIDPRTVVLAVAVGITFGTLFVAFARTGDDAGLWPLLFARVSGVPTLLVAYAVHRRSLRQRPTPPMVGAVIAPALAIALLLTAANVTYLLAARAGLLSLVAVVVSMYPASTVALATFFDGERPSRSQLAGMALAAGALVLITTG